MLLNGALQQTAWHGPVVDPHNWRDVILERIEQLDWERAVHDVTPFLQRPEDLSLVTLETCRSLLRGHRD